MRTLSLLAAIVLLALFTVNITLAGDTAPVMVEASALLTHIVYMLLILAPRAAY